MGTGSGPEPVVKEIKRRMKRRFLSEEKTRIIPDGRRP